MGLFFDELADQQQREGLHMIFTDKAGGLWLNLQNLQEMCEALTMPQQGLK
jgi:hypothetical protein